MTLFSDLYHLPELELELIFKTSRSSGKGGQHVNKTESRVEIHFDIPGSDLLSEDQKELLLSRLSHRLSAEGMLRMYSQKSRSQHDNREDVVKRFYELIAKSLKPSKKRIKTTPGPAQKEARLAEKKATSRKKESRKNPQQDVENEQ